MSRMVEFERGDVVLTRNPRSWMGRRIRGLTGGQVDHAALVWHGGTPLEAKLIEADRRVRIASLWQHRPDHEVRVYRPRNLDREEIVAILDWCWLEIGSPYGKGELIPQALDGLIPGRPVLFRRLAKLIPGRVCSSFVADAFRSQGYDFGVPSYAATPADISRFCAAEAWKPGGKYVQVFGENLSMYVEAKMSDEPKVPPVDPEEADEFSPRGTEGNRPPLCGPGNPECPPDKP